MFPMFKRSLATSATRLTEAAPGVPKAPKPIKRKSGIIRRFFRLAGLTALGTVAYTGYAVWDATHFPEQKPIDTTKPRLVILGSGWGAAALLKTIDTSKYHVTVISPRNYFLFTPLLPSTATGLVEHRSIMEPTRAILRKKSTASTFVEAEVTKIDPYQRNVEIIVKEGAVPHETTTAVISRRKEEIPFDKLVIAVGSDVSTFGIPGVKENACFLKEIAHTQQIRKRIMDCIEGASFPDLDEAERKRLLHTVVVGAGPTGVEFAGELYDFFANDLVKFNPSVVKDFSVTLVEALPNVLPSFSKLLIDYTEKALKAENVEVMTRTAVNRVDESSIYAVHTLPNGQKEEIELPYGTLVWAGGVKVRKVVSDLFSVIPEQASARRGLQVNGYLQVKGTEDIWAIGDCAEAGLAPTAQVASQEGTYLGGLLNNQARVRDYEDELKNLSDPKEVRLLERRISRLANFSEFKYSHEGSLAYIGSERAVADIPFQGQQFSLTGYGTFLFWRSAYLSMCFSLRNKWLVGLDWLKVYVFGRDVSRE